ncbi:MAG: virulence RhuM family protein [Proteobacteria bacterium]|nr:virulence RhuM family protein [Desulfobacteraceae bacterium]MBU3980537.1 virulence RhuM family protein [Pseudomonadota bacterium]MBU4012056.1 virulence RhuM family protein [Pseudomonadota bacterium]MBU4067257.1 virulence RhuM family protein [Pseudomonadota bacterium]MBU4100068.1 virulence RhuM family protein [Pseudomonadota bacterium]
MKNKNSSELQPFSNFVVFKTKSGKVNIDVFFYEETLWLTQKKMAELFEKGRTTITEHLKNIFSEGELLENSVCRDFRHTAEDGKSYVSKFYNLKAITAVGFRVNSHRAIEFRKWAGEILHEYIIKGFAMDDERLKQIKHFGQDYFDEMLERIREIRLSERRIYQKITDIYALSADYDSQADITKHFYATVQNKLHWAITGKTAAEIIYNEVDAQKAYMGLKTWKNAPDGKILKSDVSIAKNYLNEEHLRQLERIVTAYLDMAENRAHNRKVMNMADWDQFLTQFLELSDYPILANLGKVSMLESKLKAEAEFDKYRIIQDKNYVSDFDREVQKLLGNEDRDK